MIYIQGSTEPVASEKQETKTGHEPTYLQPEFIREEDRPPAREPQRPVVYSQLDAHATQKLHQEAKPSQGPTYMEPEFLREEDRPPAREPQRPVLYSRLDAKATQKLRQDELKKRAYDEPPTEMDSMLPVNQSETSSSEHDQDGHDQTLL